MTDNIIPFPTSISTSCSGRTMPGLTTPELRQRARDNFYTAERLRGVDPATAYDRSEAFGAHLDEIYARMQRRAAEIMEGSK
ncbi:MAG: hypothetical protein ABFD89_18585 [Bryobacteraceae bacterium]